MTEDEAAEWAERSGMMSAFAMAVDARITTPRQSYNADRDGRIGTVRLASPVENRIKYDTDDGALDDFLVQNVTLHIERMTAKQYSILVTDRDRAIHLVGRDISLDWQHDSAPTEGTTSDSSGTGGQL